MLTNIYHADLPIHSIPSSSRSISILAPLGNGHFGGGLKPLCLEIYEIYAHRCVHLFGFWEREDGYCCFAFLNGSQLVGGWEEREKGLDLA